MLYLPSMGFAQKFQIVQEFRVMGYPGSAINGISHNDVCLGYPIADSSGISQSSCRQVICKDRSFLNFRRPLKD